MFEKTLAFSTAIRQCIENGLSLPPAGDQTGLFQHTKLVRNGRLCHFQLLGNIHDTFLMLKEDKDNSHPCQIAEDLEQFCHICQLGFRRHLCRQCGGVIV